MMEQLANLLDEAGLYFGRERELLETVASLARTTPDGALVWRGTNAQLADALGCTTRTLGRAWQTVRAMGLPWLEVTGTRGAGLYVRCAPASNGQATDRQETPNGQATDIQRTSNGQVRDIQRTNNGQAADKLETSNGQITDSRAHVPYRKILPTEELKAGKATREETSGVEQPASQLVLTEGLAEWLGGELERRGAQLVQHTSHQPTRAALESAAAGLLSSLGSEETARRYCTARLLSYELRPAKQRPGTFARLIEWLLKDSARAELRAAAEGASEATVPTTAQGYASEGYDHDLAAAVAYGTRNADVGADEWDAQLYRDQCLQAFKTAKYFDLIPKDLEYSDDAMTRYGLWPERDAHQEALR